MLARHPRVWRRVAHAARITRVQGMRRIGNLFRTAGGPGWALVGDAWHQKDPLDGQGIYDAVFTARALAGALIAWRAGALTWEAAVARYEAEARAETYPMYLTTMERVAREVYVRHPEWVYRTVLRWIGDDPEYKRRLGRLIVRDPTLNPRAWLPRSVINRAMLRGALGDAARFVTRRPRPNAPLPLRVAPAS